MSVTVRFAPSPTGPLHIGGVRTALYNYLFARKHGGRFILRIEDTDQGRFVPGAEEYIMDSLAWLGIHPDEGVREGGAYGPYRQSDRNKAGLYRQYAEQLLASGDAYYAFDTPEELEKHRESLQGSDIQAYNYLTRREMKNSLTLPAEEVQQRLASGEPYVVRMRMPEDQDISFFDVIRQEVSFHSSQLDDKVLLKSDGMPTYHLANVVDDRLMEVTHVIRGEEWLSSTPLHVALYRALGWEDTRPQFVHLPLILNPNGQGKMSKRMGDKLGFSVFPCPWTDPETGRTSKGFQGDGYLPEALINFLALLGWNPGNNEEVMDLARMTEAFSLERLGNSATKFDLDKLNWFNQTYLRHSDAALLLPSLKETLAEKGIAVPEDGYLSQVIQLMKERITFIKEIPDAAPYFFAAPAQFDPGMVSKNWKPDTGAFMQDFAQAVDNLSEWNTAALIVAKDGFLAEKQAGAGKLMAPLRLALTGMPGGPDTFEIAALIGKAESLARIAAAIKTLG